MSHKKQALELTSAISKFSADHAEGLLQSVESSAVLLLHWLEHIHKYGRTKIADELIYATGAAVREAAAMIAIGAVRPCLFSMRAQIDLVLGWMYFKDHPVEYAMLQRSGDGFRLKRDVLSYLKEAFPGYGDRIGILTQIATRKEIDPYRLLSAHIHAQSNHVAPKVDSLKDIVSELAFAEECVSIQKDVSEYISDQLFASGIFGPSSLSSDLTDPIKARTVSSAQRAALFS